MGGIKMEKMRMERRRKWSRRHATGSDDGVRWGCGRWDELQEKIKWKRNGHRSSMCVVGEGKKMKK